MCRERTSPTLRQNVSFHLCLQESYVLTVAHSNKNVFYFTLLKVRAFVKIMAAFVWRIRTCVITWVCNPAKITTALVKTAATIAVAKIGMNPLQ